MQIWLFWKEWEGELLFDINCHDLQILFSTNIVYITFNYRLANLYFCTQAYLTIFKRAYQWQSQIPNVKSCYASIFVFTDRENNPFLKK